MTPLFSRIPARPLVRVALLPVLLATLLATTAAHAERGDRDKPTQIDADSQRIDDLKQVSVFTGNVVLTKGTLRVTGDRLEYREDPEGFQSATVTTAPGGLATFRQRRDPTRPGVEEVIEGVSERIEYDGRTETVRLIARAVVKRLENTQPRDELSGSLIVYDSRNATYDVAGGPSTKAGEPTGRVRTIISPRAPGGPPPAPAEPATLTPTRPAAAPTPPVRK
jgi:lipopolysaccharide export system protein LptA